MAYSTIDNIRERLFESELIRLTDEENSGAVDTGKVDNAIETADVEIDAYLAKQYTLPLATVLPIVTKLSVDLAIRNLYLLNPAGVPDNVDKQADNAVRMLEKIASGQLTLGAGDPAGASSDNSINISGPDRIFSRDSLKGF